MEAPWQSLGQIPAVHGALHAGTWAAWEEGWRRLRAREQPAAVRGRRPRWHSRGTGGCAAAGCSCRRNSVSAQAGGSTTGQAPSANSATQPVCRMRVSGFKAQKDQLSIIFGLFLNFMYICSLALRGSHTEHVQTHVC